MARGNLRVFGYIQQYIESFNKIDYRCKSSADRERGVCEGFTIGARILDKAAWEHAVEIIRDAKIVEQKLQGKRRQNPTHGEYEPIDRRLKEIKKEVQNLIVMGQYAQNDDTVRTLGERFAQLEREKLGLLQEQEKLQMVEKMYEEELLALLTFEQRCGMYRQKLEDTHASFTYTEKREVLEYFGIKAFVWREKHTPRFKIISSASDTATELS